MTEAEVLTGGGIVLVAMTLIQISPIKLDVALQTSCENFSNNLQKRNGA